MADEIGIWLMLWTPPATTRSLVPLITAWAAKWTDCWDEPHWRSIVTPGTCWGRPAASQQVRAMSPAWEPIVSQQPKITSSTAPRSTLGPLHEALQDVGAEVGGVDAGEAAAALADRRADGVDDVCLGHVCLSFRERVAAAGEPPIACGVRDVARRA